MNVTKNYVNPLSIMDKNSAASIVNTGLHYFDFSNTKKINAFRDLLNDSENEYLNNAFYTAEKLVALRVSLSYIDKGLVSDTYNATEKNLRKIAIYINRFLKKLNPNDFIISKELEKSSK